MEHLTAAGEPRATHPHIDGIRNSCRLVQDARNEYSAVCTTWESLADGELLEHVERAMEKATQDTLELSAVMLHLCDVTPLRDIQPFFCFDLNKGAATSNPFIYMYSRVRSLLQLLSK